MWLVLSTASAQTEFHFQYGKLTNPFSGQRQYTSILTLQNALGWKLGDSFFFVDIIEDRGHDDFNEKDVYAEWYPTLSFSKLTDADFGFGPVRDIALVGGINLDADADVLKYLPGVRLSWEVPGFVFLNTDVTAFIDAGSGVARGGAPRTSDSFMVDVNWLLPFEIGGQSFALSGHTEYIGGRTDEFGNQVRGWILSQPQLTWDLGAVFGGANQLLVGIEYQYWRNKLGTGSHDNVCQLLLIWRL